MLISLLCLVLAIQQHFGDAAHQNYCNQNPYSVSRYCWPPRIIHRFDHSTNDCCRVVFAVCLTEQNVFENQRDCLDFCVVVQSNMGGPKMEASVYGFQQNEFAVVSS